MKAIALALLVVAAAAVMPVAARGHAAERPASSPATTVARQEVDDNDDTRVEVQVAVLATVFGIVFVAGTAVYFLRKKAGLVAPPPEPASADEHH